MVEKEERAKDLIYVFSQELICKDCKDWYEHIDPLDKSDCDNCEDIADLPHISRQGAIKRMAEAMNDLTRKALESKKTPCITPENYAEAMLNSILEVK